MRTQEEPVNAIYVSSYIPRKCGIATFTKDLTNGINLLNARSLAEILVVVRPEEELEYPWEAKFKIFKDDLSTYLTAAEYVNQSNTDVVVLQHEFGLFGGEDGEYILHFIEALKKPILTTCHTVLTNPSPKQAEILKRIVDRSEVVVVMMEGVAGKLSEIYGVPEDKIVVIPHGVPDVTFGSDEKYKRKRQLSGRFVLGNINLLHPNKGIEYALEAVAVVAKVYPDVLYVVIGQTHPELKREAGEAYRNYLKKRVRELGITNNVRFVNEYLSLPDVLNWLKTMDVYVTPYLDPAQVTSGALAYAIGAGKACVSTSYVYANEVLAEGRGMLVPFRNAQALAEAVIELRRNPLKKREMEQLAYRFGRLMTWPNVAQRYVSLFRNVAQKHKTALESVEQPNTPATPL
ncbi:MAG: glycosyltransferase family 4 protein [Candidatus Colwellbacteria bacterium]|nr:glycosyltransferase family 4 protein [Candidatus Colwellbacteria bacterium]